MKTIEQLLPSTKDRIILILEQDGVDRDSVQSCVMGIACDNMESYTHEGTVSRFNEISADFRNNNREYATQALTIYGKFIAKQTLVMLAEATGIDLNDPAIQRQASDIIDATVKDFLPKVL